MYSTTTTLPAELMLTFFQPSDNWFPRPPLKAWDVCNGPMRMRRRPHTVRHGLYRDGRRYPRHAVFLQTSGEKKRKNKKPWPPAKHSPWRVGWDVTGYPDEGSVLVQYKNTHTHTLTYVPLCELGSRVVAVVMGPHHIFSSLLRPRPSRRDWKASLWTRRAWAKHSFAPSFCLPLTHTHMRCIIFQRKRLPPETLVVTGTHKRGTHWRVRRGNANLNL